METVAKELKTVIELTAAGQLRIYTVFPFNPSPKTGNQKQGKGNKKWISPTINLHDVLGKCMIKLK